MKFSRQHYSQVKLVLTEWGKEMRHNWSAPNDLKGMAIFNIPETSRDFHEEALSKIGQVMFKVREVSPQYYQLCYVVFVQQKPLPEDKHQLKSIEFYLHKAYRSIFELMWPEVVMMEMARQNQQLQKDGLTDWSRFDPHVWDIQEGCSKGL